MRVVGVDPGTHGAIAIFDPRCDRQVTIHKFPLLKLQSGKRIDLDACWALIAGIAAAFEPDLVVFEDVNGFGGNKNSTGASGFTFGAATFAVQAFFVCAGVPRQYVTPAVWKKAYGVKGQGDVGKAASIQAAKRLFPKHADLFAGAVRKADGPAEAALIAHYGATKLLGYVPC